MSQANDGKKRIEKYLLENANPEAKPIPKDDKKEIPKNDDYNEYDITDDPELDDTNW